MSHQSAAGYAGDMLAVGACRLREGDAISTLIDVRTQAEWAYVGVPDLSPSGKTALFLEWQTFPAMRVDARFVVQLSTMLELPVKGCRSFLHGRKRDGMTTRAGRPASMSRTDSKVRWILGAAGASAGRRAGCPGRRRRASRTRRLLPTRYPLTLTETGPWTCMTNPIPIPSVWAARACHFTRAVVAALLREAARGIGRGHLQQLVRTHRAGGGRRRPGAAFRADPILEELDRHPLPWPYHGGARRRGRRAGENRRFRTLVGPPGAAAQSRTHCALGRSSKAPGEAACERERSAPALQRAAARPAAVGCGDIWSARPSIDGLTFSTFQVGRSNQLAFSAAQRVAERRSAVGRRRSVRFTSTRRSGSAKPICCKPSRIPRRARDARLSI